MQNEEEQTITSGMGLSGINGSTDLAGNDGQKADVKIGVVGHGNSAGLYATIMAAQMGTKERVAVVGKTIQEVVEEGRGIKISDPYTGLPPFSMYNPSAPKKRNTNRTPPKKKRKKK